MRDTTFSFFSSQKYYQLIHKPENPLMNRTQMVVVKMILRVMIIIIVIIIHFVTINVLAQRPLGQIQRQQRNIRKIHSRRTYKRRHAQRVIRTNDMWCSLAEVKRLGKIICS
jgi:hypothetical protein